MNITLILRLLIITYTLVFVIYMGRDCLKHRSELRRPLKIVVINLCIGFFTNFLDTLGIGSFATTQASFKLAHSCDDDVMPGTLNIGDTIPVVFEFILFLELVEIAPLTLIGLLISASIGAYIGAGIVSKWPLQTIRRALGSALILLALLLSCKQLQLGPFGAVGTATALPIGLLILGMTINFFLGALMTVGVGLYAPCMAMCGAFGLNIKAAFPIMMGSCAFLMPSCGIRFIKEGKYDRSASICLTVGGIAGICVAYFLVKEMPIEILLWVVIAVMLYTAYTFFRDSAKPSEKNK
ncbi:permease [Ruminococcus sp. OM05-10BH]|nr:permease [Ruminococcus sp. OM05-10BH]